ncbi:MAG TPA: 3-hydroxybutyryl-CoA dehydrogenase [Chloroflexia bacterium]|nr:3-hydroxybutyryl-CoA dehydrogenase [Chloroflexia bacterium]
MEIRQVGVIGGGTMGNGIAQVFASSGYPVKLHDVGQAQLDRATGTIRKSLAKFVEKEKLTADQMEQALGRIETTTTLADLGSCDLVVEAIFENFDAKASAFRELDNLLKPEAILASNTSSIDITKLASVTKRPERFIGMHFFNPVPLMSLVEIIRGLATSDETYEIVRDLAEKLGKSPVEVRDYPGFVSNRVLMPMINEAVFALYEGVASKEDIDTVMKLGMNHPMGPLTLADFIGLDVCLDILHVLYDGFKDPKYRPCPLLVKMVQAGRLGRKSGEGFYNYGS